jgi:two-component system, OmpR family, alkaline phosphatase synthesis response regulator PhoP
MKILVVEDNPKLLKLLSHLLEKEGFTLFSSTSGKEALELYNRHKPDIICLDVIMEDVSGLTICRQIRALDPKATILVISSKSRDVDVQEGLAAGADEYVVKPFDLVSMTNRMRNIARNRTKRDDAALWERHFDFGDLKVFPGQLRAQRGDASIDLNFRDAGVLQLLYDNKGRSVANDALKAFCWKAESTDVGATVQWYMTQLRKKIEANPESPALIKSASGGGYIHE